MRNLELLLPRDHTQEDKFTWATVTANYPDVKIRLDGEPVELDVACDSIVDVDWLDAGRRVWVQIHGRRIIVLGQAGKWRSLTLDTGWEDLTLLNGWTNYGSVYGVPRYRKIDGVVYLQGLITGGASGTVPANLPTGFRPTQDLICTQQEAAAGNPARVDVQANGNLIVRNLSATGAWLSLSNISFPAEQ